jgi:hypothetical protein
LRHDFTMKTEFELGRANCLTSDRTVVLNDALNHVYIT